jgi:DNA-directed RNA polymerase specialized sigma24 family protein
MQSAKQEGMNTEMNRIAARESLGPSYVDRKDFCAIFEGEMHTLYSLVQLLTADHRTAEQCFLTAFNDCLDGADVFSGWERSWSRRAIVKQAIRLVKPRPDDSDSELDISVLENEHISSRLIQLRPFERFVFAMTVLERYTIRECAALLNCVPSDVEKTRVRVLQFIGGAGVPPNAIADVIPAANAGANA